MDILHAHEYCGIFQTLRKMEEWQLSFFKKVGASDTDKKRVSELFEELSELLIATNQIVYNGGPSC